MKKLKLFLLIISLLFFMPVQRASASGFVDDTISLVGKTGYYVTKYAVKASIFIVKKAVKTVVVVSKYAYNGTKDAINSNKQPIIVQQNVPSQNVYYDRTLPPQKSGDSLPPIPRYLP